MPICSWNEGSDWDVYALRAFLFPWHEDNIIFPRNFYLIKQVSQQSIEEIWQEVFHGGKTNGYKLQS